MVTRSDKDKDFSVPRAPKSAHDFSLDPLPVPEAVESDSDTAWGRWEHSLQAHDDPSAAEPDFEDTVPFVFLEDPSKKT